MKKMKIVVTAIIVTAAVGAGLAFKANNLGGSFYCSSSSGTDGGICGTNAARYIQKASGGTPLFCNITPTTTGALCPDLPTQHLEANN